MIRSLHVERFKALRDVTVNFTPLTVLIGQNDSGKTSVLEALRMLYETTQRLATEVFSGVHTVENLAWRRDTSMSICWNVVRGT